MVQQHRLLRRYKNMSTRSVIGKLQSDGQVKYIYCHSDGRPSWNGKMLVAHYMDPERVDLLLELGSLSSLDAELGSKHDFDKPPKGQCNVYGRDRGENDAEACFAKNEEAFFDTKSLQFGGIEYAYLFKDGVWHVHVVYGQHEHRFISLETYFSMS